MLNIKIQYQYQKFVNNKEKSRPVNNDPKKQECINLMHLFQLLASMKNFACLINVDETSFFQDL